MELYSSPGVLLTAEKKVFIKIEVGRKVCGVLLRFPQISPRPTSSSRPHIPKTTTTNLR